MAPLELIDIYLRAHLYNSSSQSIDKTLRSSLKYIKLSSLTSITIPLL